VVLLRGMSELTLKEMIAYLDPLPVTPTKADADVLLGIRARLQEMFRLRGLVLNCPDAETEQVEKMLACLDLKVGS